MSNLSWRRARNRKRRCKKNDFLTATTRPKLESVNEHQINRNVANVTRVIKSVHKFKELLRLKKILSDELFNKLRKQFKIIDADNNGFITKEEVTRMNVLIAPHLTLNEINRDVNQLFAHFGSNHITELEWLKAWSNIAIQQNYDLDAVNNFVHSFDAINNNDDTDFQKILSSDFSSNIGINVFIGIIKWKRRAKLKSKLNRDVAIARNNLLI